MTEGQFVETLIATSAVNAVVVLIDIVIKDCKLRRFRANMDRAFSGMDAKFGEVDERFSGIHRRFDSIDRRLDEMRDVCLSALRRFEQRVLARIELLEKHG